jgi:hypothetical protein
VTGTDSRAAVLGGENNVAFSIDSVVAGGKGNNAGGGSGTIANISETNPCAITTTVNHGLITGQLVTISGAITSSNINGDRTVTVTSSNSFTIPVNVAAVETEGADPKWSTISTAAYAFVAGGQNNKAVGKWSHAEGAGTTARGNGAHTEGFGNYASGSYAHAEGRYTTASADAGHAEGFNTSASGLYSHAEGTNTIADGYACHAEGYATTARGKANHAEGDGSYASGWYAHAEGRSTASGYYSHAEGVGCTASGSPSHAEGYNTVASGFRSHSEGSSTFAFGSYSHAGGSQSKALLDAQWARASGGHSGQLGSAQTTIIQLLRTTSDGTTETELTIGGGTPGSTSGRIVVRNNQTLSCIVNVVGRKVSGTSTDHGSFIRQVCVCNNSGTTALVGGTAQKIGTDINPGNWGPSPAYDPIIISVDATNHVLKIAVKGTASTSIRWMATVIASEVADGTLS